MLKIKLSLIVLALVAVLSAGTPNMAKASDAYEMPPAIVFIQDKDEKMLLKHNFVFDQGMMIPGNTDMDKEFFVEVQGS